MIISINPATGSELARFEAHTPAEIEAALAGAARAQVGWRATPIHQRVELLRAAARVLRAGKAEYAEMITREMGKPLPESEGEIEKCAWNCDFYAEAAPRFLADKSSTQVGSIVAAQAGKALKKQMLELGGSDPFIVLADADVELAASVAVKARFMSVGQSCVNAKRIIVEDAVADRFVAAFIAAVRQLKIGDPKDALPHLKCYRRAPRCLT